jgi:hypothetical protein
MTVDFLPSGSDAPVKPAAVWALSRTCLVALMVVPGFCHTASAQTPAPKTPATVAQPIVALDWQDLAPVQRTALAPLEATWPKLSPGQKRKWIALVRNYHQLAPPERAKLHSRMVQWAALNPRERETARLNFAATKKLSPAEKVATWEAYQALSPEDKKKFARKNPTPVGSTALAVKPAAPNTMTAVPLTRHTPKEQRDKLVTQQAIDPDTLLPLPVDH